VEEVFIGIGSNVGDAIGHCEEAVRLLVERFVITIIGLSSWYATEPQGYRDQNWFINGVLRGETKLSPRELLNAVKSIEAEMGRAKTVRWGPRVIDIDILFYGTDGQICVEEDDLYIPHRMLQDRRFVLVPLCEIAPMLMHPIYNQNVKELLRQVPPKGQKVKRVKKK